MTQLEIKEQKLLQSLQLVRNEIAKEKCGFKIGDIITSTFHPSTHIILDIKMIREHYVQIKALHHENGNTVYIWN